MFDVELIETPRAAIQGAHFASLDMPKLAHRELIRLLGTLDAKVIYAGCCYWSEICTQSSDWNLAEYVTQQLGQSTDAQIEATSHWLDIYRRDGSASQALADIFNPKIDAGDTSLIYLMGGLMGVAGSVLKLIRNLVETGSDGTL